MASLYKQRCVCVNNETTPILRLWHMDISVSTVTGYVMGGFQFPAGTEKLLLSKASRETLGITQHPVQRLSETFFRG
jgi:hypothetical protein